MEVMGMKMELIQESLAQWGELSIYTASGQVFELHSGDTTFDTSSRVIRFTSADAKYIIDGDAVDVVKMHYSHPEK